MRERSPQTLSEPERRLVAAWAADCVDRVLGLFETESPGDSRPRALIARTRAYARGELDTAEEIRRRFTGGVKASEIKSPVAKAVAVCHLGAHALSAAACAVRAVELAIPDQPDAAKKEIQWQLEHMSAEVRIALQAIPPIDKITSGPLGPGLNTSGKIGDIIRTLQPSIASSKT